MHDDINHHTELIWFLRWALSGKETMSSYTNVNNLFTNVDIAELIDNKMVDHRMRTLGDRHIHMFMTTDHGFRYLNTLIDMEKI